MLTYYRRKVAFEVVHKSVWTPTQKTDLLNQRTRLYRLVARYRSIQTAYMPVTMALIAEMADTSAPTAETTVKRKHGQAQKDDDSPDKPDPIELQKLFLPSELSPSQLSGCYSGLADIEAQLRDAQCRTSLDQLRTELYMKSRLFNHKKANVRHQGANTRAQAVLKERDVKIAIVRDRYNTARAALIALSAVTGQDYGWREITQSDIRFLEDPEKVQRDEERAAKRAEKNGTKTKKQTSGEGHRRISWIWEGAGRDADSAQLASSMGLNEGEYDHLDDRNTTELINIITFAALRVEWAKSRARSQRWQEEVVLVKEEMRRVIESLHYKAEIWVKRAMVPRSDVDTQAFEGIQAYALTQAELQANLAAKFISMWADAREDQAADQLLTDASLLARLSSGDPYANCKLGTLSGIEEIEESEDELQGAAAGSEEEEREEIDTELIDDYDDAAMDIDS